MHEWLCPRCMSSNQPDKSHCSCCSYRMSVSSKSSMHYTMHSLLFLNFCTMKVLEIETQIYCQVMSFKVEAWIQLFGDCTLECQSVRLLLTVSYRKKIGGAGCTSCSPNNFVGGTTAPLVPPPMYPIPFLCAIHLNFWNCMWVGILDCYYQLEQLFLGAVLEPVLGTSDNNQNYMIYVLDSKRVSQRIILKD